MTQEETSSTYPTLLRVATSDLEKLQSIAFAEGWIHAECEHLDVSVPASCAILTQYDFLVILDARPELQRFNVL